MGSSCRDRSNRSINMSCCCATPLLKWCTNMPFPPWCRLAQSVFRRSEEHTSELQSLMRISYAVFCLKKKTQPTKICTYDYAMRQPSSVIFLLEPMNQPQLICQPCAPP